MDVALEASTRTASVAVGPVGGDQDRIVTRALDPERAHASDLLPALDELLREQGAGPKDVERVCVGLGPGSYTGLRVAVALSKGIALAGRGRVVGVPSIEAELLDQLGPDESGSALRDARGGRYTLGSYRRTKDSDGTERLETLIAPAAVPVDQLAAALERAAETTGGLLLAEPGLLERLERDETGPAGSRPTPAERSTRTLAPASAGAVLRLGRLRSTGPQTQPLEEVAPLYLAEFVVRTAKR